MHNSIIHSAYLHVRSGLGNDQLTFWQNFIRQNIEKDVPSITEARARVNEEKASVELVNNQKNDYIDSTTLAVRAEMKLMIIKKLHKDYH